MNYLLAALFAAICAYFGVRWIRLVAERRSILDIPNERSSHARPTPRGGGLAIALVTCIGLVIAQLLFPVWPPTTLAGFLTGAAIVGVVSWIDDLRSLPSLLRLLAHCAAALVVVATVGAWPVIALPFLGQMTVGSLGYVVAFLWVVGMINIYNFMDGIDGLAGGQAVVAAGGWALIGWLSDQPTVVLLSVLIAGSSLGFLGHNWPPARIFMGDVGSTFLGYSLAVLSLLAGQTQPDAFVIGILLLWPFLFDATLTIMRRAAKGENVLASHRSHLYQRLAIVKRSHLAVTVGYLLLAVAGVWAAVAWYLQWPGGALLAALLAPVLAVGLFIYTTYCERRAVPS